MTTLLRPCCEQHSRIGKISSKVSASGRDHRPEHSGGVIVAGEGLGAMPERRGRKCRLALWGGVETRFRRGHDVREGNGVF
jgi:hypothetical protein